MREVTAIGLALLAFMGLAACGQGEAGNGARKTAAETEPPTAVSLKRPVSKRRYLRKANTFCRQLVAKTTEIRRRYLFKPSTTVRQRGLGKAAEAVREALARLTRLPQPRGDEQTVKRIYAEAAQGAAVLERGAQNKVVAQKILSGTGDPFARTTKLAREYGLTACREPVK
jgi:limonene-1,2-epoxide hydrolase